MQLPSGWYARPPAGEAVLDQLVRSVPIHLPVTYLAFLRLSNGGEGTVGGRNIELAAAEKVHRRNDSLEIYRSMPGCLLIGTDGGDTAYILDARRGEEEPPILSSYMEELEFEYAEQIAQSFAELMGQP